MLQRLCNLLGARSYDAEAGDFTDLAQKGEIHLKINLALFPIPHLRPLHSEAL
ncbi:hypothetical protein FHY22_002996 [Xanthomonas arboricola]|nr:hypothetical protein [Xanthomonas arboricola]